jgi:hypothetical protein
MHTDMMLKPRDIIFVVMMAFIGIVLFLQATKSDDSDGRRMNSYTIEIENQKKSKLQSECLSVLDNDKRLACNTLAYEENLEEFSVAFVESN